MDDKPPTNRRSLLKSLATSTGLAVVSGTGTGQTQEERKYKDRKEELIDKYRRMDREDLIPIFNEHADTILSILAKPVDEVGILQKHAPKSYSEAGIQLIESPDITAFDFRFGHSSIVAEKKRDRLVVRLVARYTVPDYSLSLSVQPELNRSYVIIDFTFEDQAASENLIIEEKNNNINTTNSNCITATPCRNNQFHAWPCTHHPGCHKTEIYCCRDTETCWWGNNTRRSCDASYCESDDCRYHCGYY